MHAHLRPSALQLAVRRVPLIVRFALTLAFIAVAATVAGSM